MKKYIIIIISTLFVATTMNAQIGNTISGDGSGKNANSINYLTVFGDSSAVNLTSTNSYSTYLGYGAGYSSTSASYRRSTVIGYEAGYFNKTGTKNLMVGYRAGKNNTAYRNTFIGGRAGRDITTGYKNTFIGRNAGRLSTISNNSIFIGGKAGTGANGSDNLFIGYYVGGTSSTGSYNLGIGFGTSTSSIDADQYDIDPYIWGAFEVLTTGTLNTAIGVSAGARTKVGSYNTYAGTGAGHELDNGVGNTFIGFGAGEYVRSNASHNTFIGYGLRSSELYDVFENIIVGTLSTIYNSSDRIIMLGTFSKAYANDAILVGHSIENNGDKSISIGEDGFIANDADGTIGIGYQTNMDNGNYSIGIGSQADIDNAYAVGIGTSVNIDNVNGIAIGNGTSVTGDNSIALGNGATVSGANSIAIGNGVNVSSNNTVTIGNSSVTSIRGSVNWTALSDGRYKTDVQENVVGLDFINQLRPVSYELKSQNDIPACQGTTGRRYNGFIAQEVEAVAKNVGFDFSGIKTPQNKDDIYGLRYAEFVVPLTKAIQELDEEYQNNEVAIATIDAKLLQYKDAVAELEAKVEALKMKKSMPKNPLVTVNK